MPNKEKVIKGMEMCISPNECSPDDCPYYICPNNESGLCWDRIMADALVLLKEKDEEIENLKQTVQSMMEGICLLKEQEARELTIDEWKEWKENPKRNPICKLWKNDTSPMWILDPNNVHEPALLMGELKLFTGKPTFEQCKEVKWE